MSCDGPGIVLAEIGDGGWGAEFINSAEDELHEMVFPDRASAESFARSWLATQSGAAR